MMPVSFSVCLHLGASSSRTFSLLPSRHFNPLYAAPPPSSEGGKAAAAASRRIAKVRTAVKPAEAGCPHPSRCSAKAQHRATFPKGEPRRLPPHATELQRCEPRLSPPGRAALICHGAAQKRSTAAERRYCRCAYRRSSAAGGAKAVFSKGKGFSPHKFAVFVAPRRVFCYNTFNNTQNAQKGLFV